MLVKTVSLYHRSFVHTSSNKLKMTAVWIIFGGTVIQIKFNKAVFCRAFKGLFNAKKGFPPTVLFRTENTKYKRNAVTQFFADHFSDP